MKYLKDTIQVKGFRKGLITDGNEGERFPDSVVDCLNMDFLPHGTRRRNPYIASQEIATLLSSAGITEYEIVNYYQKTFYNSNGLSKNCTVYVINEYDSATHTPAHFIRARIYIKGYYGPANGYDNSLFGNAVRAKGILTPTQLINGHAIGSLTGTANFADGDTVTISDITHAVDVIYTFKDALVAGGNPYEVLKGGSLDISLRNLMYAVHQTAGHEGTEYGNGTVEHADIETSVINPTQLFFIAKVAGSLGNTINTSSSNGNIVWGHAHLEGGVDMVNFKDGFAATLSNLAGGTGYSNASNVAVTGGSGTGLTVDIVTTAGVITSAVINNPGVNYEVGDTVTITGGNGDATVDIASINCDKITIGTTVYSFKNALSSPAVANEILIGTTTLDTLIYLVDALVYNSAYEGTHFSTGTVVNPDVTSEIDYATGIIVLTSRLLGTAGNSVVTTETSAAVGFGDTTLIGGDGEETGSAAFNDNFVELTENIPESAIGGEEYSVSGWADYRDYNFRVLKTTPATFNYTLNYYKGWFVNNGTDIWGFVEASVASTTHIYFKINFEESSTAILGFSRFAVGFEALDIFTSTIDANTLRDYTFSEFPNGLKIYPQGERILQIQFIKNRININMLISSPVTPAGWITSYEYSGSEEKTYMLRFDKIDIDSTHFWVDCYVKEVNVTEWTKLWRDGIFIYSTYYIDRWDNMLFGNIKVTAFEHELIESISGIELTFTMSTQAKNKWDGFYFDYDVPKILTKKNYYLIGTGFTAPAHGHATKELGVWFQLDASGAFSGETVFYSYLVQIDGFQTLFIFNAVSIKNDLRRVGIKMYLKPYFNRRITGFVQGFYQELTSIFTANLKKDNEVPNTFVLNDNAPGEIIFSKAGFMYDNNLKQYYVNGVSSATGHSSLVSWANGISIQSLLNQYYWKEVAMKCEGGTEIGDNNTLVYGIKDDIIKSEDNESKITGELSIAISNKQSGAINTHSIFGSERFKEVAKSKIIDVVAITGYQFLIFTKDSCKWMEIDTSGSNTFEICILKEHGTYEGYGAIDKKAIARISFKESASMGTASWEFGAMEFDGIIFGNEESIFIFVKNKPVDLLYDEVNNISYLREYYQSLDKTGMTFGYNPCRREVYCYVDGKILVYNTIQKNWTIYEFGDIPLRFSRDEEGRITFTDGAAVYRTTEQKEGLYLDKGTVGIAFFIEFIRNHKSNIYKKIFDRIELNWEHEPVYNMSEPLDCGLNITIYKKDTAVEILSKSFNLNFQNLKAYKNGNRIAANFYKVLIESKDGNEANFESFQLNEITTKAIIIPGRLAGAI